MPSPKMINRGSLSSVEIEGFTFRFRGLTAGEKGELHGAIEFQPFKIIDGDQLARVLAKCIVSIEGCDVAPATVVRDMESFVSLGELFSAVLNHSSLSGDEAKNSQTSLSGPSSAATPPSSGPVSEANAATGQGASGEEA